MSDDATPVALMWSGGKDAALALRALRDAPDWAVRALLVTLVGETERVTMHGTPRALIDAQAEALGLPLHVMRVPPSPSNATYETALERAVAPLKAAGVTALATGDLYLSDIREYRESIFRPRGLRAVFPLWERDTTDLAQQFVTDGYRAVVTSIDTTQLDPSFAGRSYDAAFLDDLPASVDPCGENGAFHTFVTNGPGFASPVPVAVGEAHGTGRMRYVRVSLRA